MITFLLGLISGLIIGAIFAVVQLRTFYLDRLEVKNVELKRVREDNRNLRKKVYDLEVVGQKPLTYKF